MVLNFKFIYFFHVFFVFVAAGSLSRSFEGVLSGASSSSPCFTVPLLPPDRDDKNGMGLVMGRKGQFNKVKRTKKGEK